MTDPVQPTAARWRSIARWMVLVVGFVGLVLVTRRAVADDETVIPSASAVAIAAALYGGAGMAVARAWATLLGSVADPVDARGAMYASQLAKYVPGGGVLQAAGQVALSTTGSLPVRRVALTWATSMVLTILAGVVLMSGLVFVGGLPTWARVVAPLGLAGMLAVDRTRLGWLLRVARRVVRRIPPPEALADDSSLRRGFAWTALSMGLNAASFTVILVDLHPGAEGIQIAPAFVAGWLAGFLLVPLPAGVGVREAVVVALVPGVSTGLLLAASVSQRVVAAGAELALVVGHRAAKGRNERSRQQRGSPR